jgi:hypothetical protein
LENITAFGFFKANKSVSAMVDFSLVLVAFRKTAVFAPSSVWASRDARILLPRAVFALLEGALEWIIPYFLSISNLTEKKRKMYFAREEKNSFKN